jgi:large subunit ribosomal protein L5
MEKYTPRLHQAYKEQVIPTLLKEFDYPNVMMVPKLEKIVLNFSMKEALQNRKLLETSQEALSLIAGQHAVITKARRSVANFKLRQGQPLGSRVTLRRHQMWEFLDRLVSVAIPRIRDFRGINPKSFDGRGNYSLGLVEQLIFPEVHYEKVTKVHGLNVSFVTTANTDKEGLALLRHIGVPFAS